MPVLTRGAEAAGLPTLVPADRSRAVPSAPVATTAPAGGIQQWVAAYLAAAALYVAIGSLVSVLAVMRGIAASGELMFSEGTMLFNFLEVRDGRPLYRDYQDAPFVPASYTPLYYWLVGSGSRLLGVGVDGTLLLARTWALVGGALAAAAVIAWARLLGASGRSSALAGGLFITSFVFHPWAYTARPDTLALGLALAGMVVALAGRSPANAVLGATLLAAAFFTKQSYVVAIAALAAATLQQRDWKYLAALLGAYGLCVAAPFILIDRFTEGQLAANVVGANAVPVQLWNLPRYVVPFLLLSAPLLTLASIGLWRPVCPPFPVLALRWYVLLSSLFAGLTLVKIGSYYNYFLEPVAAFAVLAALGHERLRSRLERPPKPATGQRAKSFLAPVLVTLGVLSWILPTATLVEQAREAPDSRVLVELIRQTPGEVLTERDSLAVLRAGKAALAPDPLHLSVLSTAGRWDARPLHALVENRAFALIVLESPADTISQYDTFPWWPEGMLDRVRSHYTFTGMSGPYYLYAPAKLMPAQQDVP